MSAIRFAIIQGTLIAAVFLLGGCGDGGGGVTTEPAPGSPSTSVPVNESTVVLATPFAATTTCSYGGIHIEWGIDDNGNGVLDPAEVDGSGDVCNGAPGAGGAPSLINVTEELPGANCPFGGVKIESGLDSNGNGFLDAGEVNAIQFLCNRQSILNSLLFRVVGGAIVNVFSVDPGAASPNPLTNAAGIVWKARYSPDKTRIALLGELDVAGVIELYVVDLLNNWEIRKVSGNLVSGGDVFSFEWSPDSTKLAYSANQDTVGVVELYVTLADGSGLVKVSGPMVSGGQIEGFAGLSNGYAWSPDGSRIAYRADQEVDTKFDIFVVFPFTPFGRIKVSSFLFAPGVRTFAWAPDSSRVAFVGTHGSGAVNKLYVSQPDQAGMTEVSGPLVSGGVVQYQDWRWSPDSAFIAYKADQSTDEVFELYVSTPDGLSNQKISGAMVTGGDVSNFAWAPNGSRVAYTADQGVDGVQELYTVLPNGTSNTKVSGPLVTGGQVLTFDSSCECNWAPDSSMIAYGADAEVDNVFELYVALPDGSGIVKVSGAMPTFADAGAPEWASDSSRLAFVADKTVDGQFELFTTIPGVSNSVVSVSGPMIAGGSIRNLGGGIYGGGPAFLWAPNNSLIAYVADQLEFDVTELFVVVPDGTGRTNLSDLAGTGSDVIDFTW